MNNLLNIDREKMKFFKSSKYITISGIVEYGFGIGSKIKYPTANICSNDKENFELGVYAVFVLIENKIFKGMLNIGIRPTFEGKNKTIEVNIFNLKKIIYGREIKLFLVKKIRNEIKFDNIEQLKRQLYFDKVLSKKILGNSLKPII